MLDGIGVDLIEISRIAEAIGRHPRFVEHVFTAREIDYCASKGHPEASYAGRFAAKEAVAKALGVSLGWRDVEILCDANGKPYCVLHGRAARIAGNGTVHISISHTREHAIAQAAITYNTPER